MTHFNQSKPHASNVGFQFAMLIFVVLFPLATFAQGALPKLVAIIDPYPAGGLGDILPRALANVLAEQTGHTFIIENKPGATQTIGTYAASRAPHDGTVILFGS